MLGTCWPENKLLTNREKMVKHLVQGQEFATQLQILINKPCGDLSSTDELIVKILKSFTEALTLLNCNEFHEISQNLATSQVDSVCCVDDRRSEDSGESKKRPNTKDKRGCYKRKKPSQSWTTVSDKIEDGHAWRKYGQKEILNAAYPRSYFRCTYKYDRDCKATKQVQKMEEDPQLYKTTYVGHHTCRDTLKIPQIITTTTDSDPCLESYMLDSSSKIPFNSSIGAVKQECKEEAFSTPSDLTDNLSSLDSAMWKDFMGFESATSQSLDLDFVVKSIDFDCTDFHFDESHEFNHLSL